MAHRRTAALLGRAGWAVNVACVERIWRREGLKVPDKQPRRGRLWLNGGSGLRVGSHLGLGIWFEYFQCLKLGRLD
jgi:putative transposase